MALAAELRLQAHVVEKDYALGWFLAGIAAHPEIGPSWVFTHRYLDQEPAHTMGQSRAQRTNQLEL